MAVLVAPVAAVPARADDSKAECVAASEDAQLLRIRGQLVEARSRLLVCAREVCPALVKHDCEGWLTEVDASLPTVVLAAKDAAGHDLEDVHVVLDDRPLAERLDGNAIAIDAGAHVLRFEHAGDAPIEQRLVIREGQKDRLVSVTFAAPPQPAAQAPSPAPSAATPLAPPAGSSEAMTTAPEAPRPAANHGLRVPVLTWILGGVGVAALGVGTYFGIDQLSRYDSDKSSGGCADTGGCKQSELDAISNERLVAGISLGVGAAALAVGAIVLFTSQDKASAGTAWQLVISPAARGTTMGLGTSF